MEDVYLFYLENLSLFSHSVKSDSLQPVDCRTPGTPVIHRLQEFAQVGKFGKRKCPQTTRVTCTVTWTTVGGSLAVEVSSLHERNYWPGLSAASHRSAPCFGLDLWQTWASLVAQTVKNLPAMQETWVQPVGQEDPLETGMATHCRILAWRISWTEEPGGLQSVGPPRVGCDWEHTDESVSELAYWDSPGLSGTERLRGALMAHFRCLLKT